MTFLKMPQIWHTHLQPGPVSDEGGDCAVSGRSQVLILSSPRLTGWNDYVGSPNPTLNDRCASGQNVVSDHLETLDEGCFSLSLLLFLRFLFRRTQ